MVPGRSGLAWGGRMWTSLRRRSRIGERTANVGFQYLIYGIEDTSHDFPLHKSAEKTVKEMSKWLKSF